MDCHDPGRARLAGEVRSFVTTGQDCLQARVSEALISLCLFESVRRGIADCHPEALQSVSFYMSDWLCEQVGPRVSLGGHIPLTGLKAVIYWLPFDERSF